MKIKKYYRPYNFRIFSSPLALDFPDDLLKSWFTPSTHFFGFFVPPLQKKEGFRNFVYSSKNL